ncbi:hypothetical protein Dimus_038163 [Dionaea muscipula]
MERAMRSPMTGTKDRQWPAQGQRRGENPTGSEVSRYQRRQVDTNDGIHPTNKVVEEMKMVERTQTVEMKEKEKEKKVEMTQTDKGDTHNQSVIIHTHRLRRTRKEGRSHRGRGKEGSRLIKGDNSGYTKPSQIKRISTIPLLNAGVA